LRQASTVYEALMPRGYLGWGNVSTLTMMTDHHVDAGEGIQAFRDKRPSRFNQWLEAE
jgi:hypothetical protein